VPPLAGGFGVSAPPCARIVPYAGVAELADAPGLGPKPTHPKQCHPILRS
jgi:hypothetical protein